MRAKKMGRTNSDKQTCVSVILPVWNPGPGISRCIESLRGQTLKDIEMIFIDDCGTDDSMDKVRAAATEDDRIRIIENEENLGPGPSRNRGIEVARGEYLSFVDPDDYVALDFLELLYTKGAEDHIDIVKGSFLPKKEDGTVIDDGGKVNSTIRKRLDAGTSLNCAFIIQHQSAIYRRDLMCSNTLRYGSARRGEDSIFLLQACSQTENFSMVEEARYYYCERHEGAMHAVDARSLEGVLMSTREQVDYVLWKGLDSEGIRRRMKERFLFCIREATRYEEKADMEDLLSSYAQDLRSELKRLPYHKELAMESLSLCALENHGILLPNYPYTLVWGKPKQFPIRYGRIAGQWVDYYELHPREAENCEEDLSRLFMRAELTLAGADSTYDREELRAGKRLLRKHKKRLPLGMRSLWVPRYIKGRMNRFFRNN